MSFFVSAREANLAVQAGHRVGLPLVAFILALVFNLAAFAAPKFPALAGRVVDEANVIPAPTKGQIEAKLAALEQKTTDQFVVVTLASLQGYEIADFGYQLGRAWGIGQKDKNNGVLLIVAPKERDVRIEVGYGLEGDLTDAVTKLIIENAILPKFRAGDMAGGISAGVDDVIKVLTGDAALFKQQAAERQKSYEADRPDDRGGIPFSGILFIIIVLIVVWRTGWWPLLFMGRGGRGWSGGGRSWGSGSSGGGFSGGGGSFGGGGSSGRW